MKRREFIKAGAATATVAGAAGAGGLVGSACAGLLDGKLFDEARPSLPEMDDYLRKVDDGMRRIAEWDRRDDIPETELDRALENDLGKKALRALYMAGMFGDLPDAGQVHPGMQARVKRALPEMDEAVTEMVEYLESVSDEDVERLQAFLDDRENPSMEAAQWFDEVESALGVSRKRRLQTRVFITHAVSRLRNQPPSLVFEDCIGKVEKLSARSGSAEEIERQMIARMGREAFFERQQRLAVYAAAWQDVGATVGDGAQESLPPVVLPPAGEPSDSTEIDGGVADASVPPPVATTPVVKPPSEKEQAERTARELEAQLAEERKKSSVIVEQKKEASARQSEYMAQRREDRKQRRKRGLIGGGVCLGVGAVLLAVAIVMINTGGDKMMLAGAFVATPGVILLIVGMIVMLAAAARYRDV